MWECLWGEERCTMGKLQRRWKLGAGSVGAQYCAVLQGGLHPPEMVTHSGW